MDSSIKKHSLQNVLKAVIVSHFVIWTLKSVKNILPLTLYIKLEIILRDDNQHIHENRVELI